MIKTEIYQPNNNNVYGPHVLYLRVPIQGIKDLSMHLIKYNKKYTNVYYIIKLKQPRYGVMS